MPATALRTLLALLLLVLPSIAHAQAWWDQAWTRREQLTLLDSGTTETLTNVPVMVKLTAARVTYAQFKASGADLRFVDNSNNPLPYEIETWNTSGTSIVWVNVGTVASGSGGIFWMYWGNAAATDAQNAAGVWPTNTTPTDKAPDYQAVWHLDGVGESTSATGRPAGQQVAATLTPSPVGVNAPGPIAAQIAGGYRLDGVDDFLQAPTGLLGPWLGAAATLEFWIKSDEDGGSAFGSSPGLVGNVDSTGNAEVRWGQVHGPSAKALLVSGDNDEGNGPAVIDNIWHHVAFTRGTDGHVSAFVDGGQFDFDPGAGTSLDPDLGGAAETVSLRDFGRIIGSSEPYLQADLDELRIYSGRMGLNWIRASYRSQTDALISWCAASPPTWYADTDGDGYGNVNTTQVSCSQQLGYVANSTDCNDGNNLINPATLWYHDNDADTYGTGSPSAPSCTAPVDTFIWAPRLGDSCDSQPLAWNVGTCGSCNDTDGDTAWELCDAYTALGPDSCDAAQPLAWTPSACISCIDFDADLAWKSCDTYTPVGQDCNDNNARTWNTCGTCVDGDTDTHWTGCNVYLGVLPDLCDGSAANPIQRNNWDSGCSTCADNDGDGKYSVCDIYTTITEDHCDTNNQVVDENNWTAPNCNLTTGCKDRDGDGAYSVCDQYLASGTYAITEDHCDTNNQLVDENNWTTGGCNLTTGCKDRDGDGKYSVCDQYLDAGPYTITRDYCDVNGQVVDENNWTQPNCQGGCKDFDQDDYWVSCDIYSFHVTNTFEGQDCVDNDALVNPETNWYFDGDHDGYGSTAYSSNPVCVDPGADWVVNNTDCNDGDASLNPTTTWYRDADLDTFGNPSISLNQCPDPTVGATKWVRNDDDCNDTTGSITVGLWYRDFDADTYGDALVTGPGCTQPGGYVNNDDDCDDHNAQRHLDDGDGLTFTQEDAVGADNCSADSEGDGIGDAIEWGGPGTSAARDSDDDDVPDVIDDDDDNDGLLTEFESDDDLDGAPECGFAPDGIPSYLDIDSDGDGVCDGGYSPLADECVDFTSVPDRDPLTAGDQSFPEYVNLDYDSDGVDNVYDYDDLDHGACDADGDGLPSLTEVSICFTPVGGSQICLDAADGDTNGDGVRDGTEVGGDVLHPLDTDDDDIPDWWDLDDDGDGVLTLDEDYEDPPDGDPTNDHTDGDGIPDYLDADDDGDGVPTLDEDRDGDLDPRNDDTDGDGVVDYLDFDDEDGPLGDHDRDSVANGDEEAAGTDPEDPDTDGDGILDGLEWEDALGNRLDTDGDEIFDVFDLDDDGDGIPTAIEGAWDADEDGIDNYLDLDADDDGATDRAEGGDSWESAACTLDPQADECLPDGDEDGVPDFLDASNDRFDTGGGGNSGDDTGADAGCACGVVTAPASGFGALGLVMLAGLRRRRRAG